MRTTMNHLLLSFGLCLFLATGLLAYRYKEPAPNCHKPAKIGPCRAYFVRYFYNTRTRRCQFFVYGGCHGNGNNYETFAGCQNRCKRKITRPPRLVCTLKRDPGLCFGYFRRYYYDTKTRRCKMFVYGGCLGNRNRFTSKRSCERACKQR